MKNYINEKLSEKTEIINNKNVDKHSRNIYLYNTKTEKFSEEENNYCMQYDFNKKKESDDKEKKIKNYLIVIAMMRKRKLQKRRKLIKYILKLNNNL